MEAVENNQAELDLGLLTEEALELGITVHPKAKAETIAKKIEEKKAEIKAKQEAKKQEKEAKANQPKIKCIISHKEGDDYKVQDQFFGFNGKNILVKFDEEVEIDKDIYDFIKTVGSYEHYFKMVNDADGIPRKQWDRRFRKRFNVEKID